MKLPALLCVVQSEVASTVVCGAVWGCQHCCVRCSMKLPALLCVVQSGTVV